MDKISAASRTFDSLHQVLVHLGGSRSTAFFEGFSHVVSFVSVFLHVGVIVSAVKSSIYYDICSIEAMIYQ